MLCSTTFCLLAQEYIQPFRRRNVPSAKSEPCPSRSTLLVPSLSCASLFHPFARPFNPPTCNHPSLITTMKASATLVLVAGFLAASCLGSSQPVKRSPDRRYYTLHIPSSEAHLAVQAADALGVQYEGPVGELTTYYLVSTLDHEQLYKRDQAVAAATAAVHDPILEAFHAHKERRWLGKRDTENNDWWDRVHAMDAQVPRQRVKRAVLPEHHVKREPPFVEINQGKLTLEDAQETLGIQDPGFPRQWHLVWIGIG